MTFVRRAEALKKCHLSMAHVSFVVCDTMVSCASGLQTRCWTRPGHALLLCIWRRGGDVIYRRVRLQSCTKQEWYVYRVYTRRPKQLMCDNSADLWLPVKPQACTCHATSCKARHRTAVVTLILIGTHEVEGPRAD